MKIIMTDWLMHPGIILILGGIAMLMLPNMLRKVLTFGLPLLALFGFLGLPDDYSVQLQLFGYHLFPLWIDGLSWIFALIFIIAAFITALYSLHNSNRSEQATIPIYAGSAIGAVLAGDLLTLFVFWEISAISSTIIIWLGNANHSRSAGMRYLFVHITSGLLLLLGSILHYRSTQSLEFTSMGIVNLTDHKVFKTLKRLVFHLERMRP